MQSGEQYAGQVYNLADVVLMKKATAWLPFYFFT